MSDDEEVGSFRPPRYLFEVQRYAKKCVASDNHQLTASRACGGTLPRYVSELSTAKSGFVGSQRPEMV